MFTNQPFSRTRLLAAWVLSSVFGWAFAPINAFDGDIRTYAALASQMLGFLLCGVLMGAVIAVGQAEALRRHWRIDARRWLWATLIGYALMLPAGLALHTVLMFPAFGIDFLPLTQPATVTFWTLPHSALFGGVAVGVAQWQALKRFAPRRDGVMAALWIFGTWACLSVGWMIGSLIYFTFFYTPGPLTSFNIEHRLLIGLCSGLLHGLLLLLALRAEARPARAVASVR